MIHFFMHPKIILRAMTAQWGLCLGTGPIQLPFRGAGPAEDPKRCHKLSSVAEDRHQARWATMRAMGEHSGFGVGPGKAKPQQFGVLSQNLINERWT